MMTNPLARRRALVCSPLVPAFDRESGSQRIFDLIEFLREAGWAVTFVAQNAGGNERYLRLLQQRGVETHTGFGPWLERIIETRDFDVALVAFWYAAEHCLPLIRQGSPRTRLIVDTIDLHFVRKARQVFREAGDSLISRRLDSAYADEMIRELNTYASADAVVVVSDREAEILNVVMGLPDVPYTVPDCEDFAPSTVPFEQRKGILFVGNFKHPPNLEAVEYFCGDVLPLLPPSMLAEHPVYIVGNALGDRVRSLAGGLRHVRMIGWVPSVLPYLERARISVVPVLHGAGTKRKLLQALLVGTPTVSTSIGTEGLSLLDNEHVLVADNPDAFAAAITNLLRDEAVWQRLSQAGRAHVLTRHGRELVKTRFNQMLSEVLERNPKHAFAANEEAAIQVASSERHYDRLVQRVREIINETLPSDACVLVVSRGDDNLLNLNGREGWHFLQTETGLYAGHHPSDSASAIRHLETLRLKGADFLVFPSTARWWLQHYGDLQRHLDTQYRRIVDREDACLIYALREYPPGFEEKSTESLPTVRR